MANHVKQLIREAAAAALTGLTTSGARVFKSRLTPLAESELPALRITTNDEQVVPASVGGLRDRTLELNVECVARQSASLDDLLNTMEKEVEMALAANYTLGGLVKSVELTGSKVEMSAESDMPTGQAIMSFEVNYFTNSDAPDVSI